MAGSPFEVPPLEVSPFELTTRSGSAQLPAFVGSELSYQVGLSAEARKAAWRVVELYSRSGLPFAARLTWSGGAGAGMTARLCAATATRVSVYARSLTVEFANRSVSAAGNAVGVNVGDGYDRTLNYWQESGIVSSALEVAFSVPPFAKLLRVELSDHGFADSVLVKLQDADGTILAHRLVASQLGSEMWAAIASKVVMSSLSEDPVGFTLLFGLGV